MSLDEIVSNPKLCGIIGYPLAHSLSPLMHKAAFKTLGLDYDYSVFEIPEHELSTKLDKLKEMGFRGLNVTMPYKTKVMEYLDKLDDLAREIGAVNTIVNDEDILTGYNTDSHGALEALTSNGVDVKNIKQKILILGAGGGARAVAIPLSKLGHEIIIANRTVETGERLASELGSVTTAKFVKLDEIKDVYDKIDIIINCTPIGMNGNPDHSPIPTEFILKDMVVFDMVYSPKCTELLKNAEAQGASVIFGFEMLIHQGARSFELWTGEQAPIEIMRTVVIDELEDRK